MEGGRGGWREKGIVGGAPGVDCCGVGHPPPHPVHASDKPLQGPVYLETFQRIQGLKWFEERFEEPEVRMLWE